MKLFSGLLISFLLASSSYMNAQKTVEGVTFKKNLNYKGKTLVLNGAGLREKWVLDLYVAGLYVENTTNKASEIINSKTAQVMHIEIVSSLVTGEKMASATKEGFEKVMDGNTSSIDKEINELTSLFAKSPLSKGDNCMLKFSGADQVEVFINGSLKKTFNNTTFKTNLLKVWFSENSVDDTLKKQLLNL